MATLLQENHLSSQQEMTESVESDIDAGIPAPFPKELAQQLMNQVPAESNDPAANMDGLPNEPSRTINRPTLHISPINTTQEVRPSMMHVQQSCLMTLNNLLSQDAQMWQPIVPARRHSLPVQSPVNNTSSSFQTLLQTHTSSSALQTLVSNLRFRDDTEMREVATDDMSLLRELKSRVIVLVDNGFLKPRDALLAKSLVSLLTHLNHLSLIDPESSYRSAVDTPQSPSATDIYGTLSRQVSELQSRRDAHMNVRPSSSGMQTPVQVVESALLWNRIDDELEEVSRLCRERTEPNVRPISPNAPSLPPEYEVGDHELQSSDHELPSYDPAEYSETAAAKLGRTSQESTLQSQYNTDEKMRLDLEAVTMAIDRLYLVAPQLSNQRVELKRSKLEQMERARTSGSNADSRSRFIGRTEKGKENIGNVRERGATVTGGKMKAHDVQELDKMLGLISKASSRRIEGQSVVLDGKGGMAERAERSRLRDLAKRDQFHERLVTHSTARRLTSQDAIPSASSSTISLGPKTRNPDALLTLPEFIREAVPDTIEQERDPETLLTLPEFVRELPAAPSLPETALNAVTSSASKFMKKPFGPSRHRSVSAPPLSLAWLINGPTPSVRTPLPLVEANDDGTDQNGRQLNGRSTPIRAGLDVQYVAEHQENLHCVSVFLQVSGQQTGVDIEVEVVPSGGERLIVKCGASTSAPLSLPARVLPGKKEVKVQGGHFELKLVCSSEDHAESQQCGGNPPGTGLLDATQLKSLNPTSFICASCSLPIVQSSRVSRYDDLPSEHWAELLEAWMCHSDQKLNDRIAQYADGLVPIQGQALVGGSYVLFHSSSVMANNIHHGEPSMVQSRDDWRRIRCICGAVIGRCQQQTSTSAGSIAYRLAKYAIRPVSPSSDPWRIPLSAFILEDMDELVRAHATYRFMVQDEEEEKPRILLWMFKPHMRIAYATSTYHFLARSASIKAAKVHYKILGPSVSPTLKSTTEKYPGFAQSERLVYPLDICRRLAGLLKESNATYPQGHRIMAGLDIGWLLRA